MATETDKKKTAAKSQSSNDGVFEEITQLVEAVKNGKLDTRANADNFEGQDQVMLQGVNELVDTFMAPFNVMAEYVERISKGDIPEKITDDYNGDFNEVNNNLNACIGALNALVEGTRVMAAAAAAGDLDTRADEDGYQGDYARIIHGVNETMDGVAKPVKDIGRVTDLIAAGDCSAKVTEDYKGEYDKPRSPKTTTASTINPRSPSTLWATRSSGSARR